MYKRHEWITVSFILNSLVSHMFATYAHVNTFIHTAKAIYIVNKRNGSHLSNKALRVLATVFQAENRGESLTQHQLSLRLEKFRNTDNRQACLSLVSKLHGLGLLEKKRRGQAVMISCTLSGKDFVIEIERALRNVRFNK